MKKKTIAIVLSVIAVLGATMALDVNASAAAFFHQHEYVEEVISATCTEDGSMVYTCECGDTYSEITSTATGHNHVAEVVDATCTERGYINNVCACGDSYKDNYVDALGHDFDEWVNCVSCGGRN